MPDAPPVVYTPPSAGSPPAAPGAVFTPPSAGSPPAAPAAVFDPTPPGARVRESVTISGVTGLGASGINGTHYLTGVYGGKKCFGGAEALPIIGWDGTRWELNPLGGGSAYIAGGGDVPPDGTWTNVIITGTMVTVYTAPVAGYAAPDAVFSP